MGFRFRKSIKVAPGVKINLGKKGASVTVGNKYARTTIGKGRRTDSFSIPGTGVSYVKQTSNKGNKTKTAQPSNQISSNGGAPNPNQPISWETALRIIKWSFYAFLGFIILMMANDSKAVYVGAAVIIFGMILTRLKRKSIINFKPTWIFSTVGWILCLILWVGGIDTADETSNKQPDNEINSSVSTPTKQESSETVVGNDTDVINKTEETEVKVDANTTQEQPESNAESVVEQPVSEPVVNTSASAKEYFSNCKEMNAVYPNGVPSDHPAYDSARDRDKDGWACER